MKPGRSPNGWLPPPRPIYVPPSFDSNDSDEMTRWKILLDWAHDDDLKDFVLGAKLLLWNFGGALAQQGNLAHFPTDTLIAFYFLGPNPSSDALLQFSQTYVQLWQGSTLGTTQSVVIPGVAGNIDVPVAMPPEFQALWYQLDGVITDDVIPKRAALGPLPPNAFLDVNGNLADPVVINYYDDVWIKRISYPLASITQAATLPQWWAVGQGVNAPTIEQWGTSSTDILGNRSPTYSTDPNGGWFADGWDIAQGTGAFFDIAHAIVAAIGIVLTMTGVGAFVSTFIVAVLNIALDLLNAASDSISGGDPAGALVNIGQALMSVATASVGQIAQQYPSIAKLGNAGLKQLGATLNKIGTDLTPNHQQLNLSDALDMLTTHAASYTAMTYDQFNALLALLSGNNSAGVPLAQSGWDTAQYASRDDIVGVGKIYEQSFTGPAAALWKLGAQLGTLSVAQGYAGVSVPSFFVATTGRTNIQAIASIFSPLTDLMNYVTYTLKPRYHL